MGTTSDHSEEMNILAYNNLSLCKADYFETCWCKLNRSEVTTCSYLLRHVASSSNLTHFCVYHNIRKIIECFNSTSIFSKSSYSASNMYIYFTILLFIVGIIGNGLSIIVLFAKTLRCLSIYRNLIILCALNIFYLLAISSRHINIYNQDLRNISPNVCRWHTFIVAFTGHLCSWQLVSTSIQRVHASLSLQLHRTASWIQIFAILFLCIVLPLLVFDGQLVFKYGFLSKRHMCDESSIFKIKQFQRALDTPITTQSELLRNVTTRYYSTVFRTPNSKPYFCGVCTLWNILDTFIYAIIPFLLILISSIIIIIKIWQRRRLTITIGGVHQINPRFISIQDKLSILLILINCLFLIMTGPFNTHLIIQSTLKYFFSKPCSMKMNTQLNEYLRILQNLYHALSFMFYCLIGNKFRQAAYTMCQRCYWKFIQFLCRYKQTQASFLSCYITRGQLKSRAASESLSNTANHKRLSDFLPMTLMGKQSSFLGISNERANEESDAFL
ncbi:unnamed protein product [Adineta ricciae]|uniref:G-protein coupled receptors family 1 profile domain-containing protein n=1 Tax=Adineta ricciae TaxID=249248 RepID=A0A814YU53_ADIRI|nr:unnamed protein product [Adineta ricciae]